MPPKSHELSPNQRKLVDEAVQQAKSIQGPNQEILVPIDQIDNPATRLAMVLVLQAALKDDEDIQSGVIASVFINENGKYLKVKNTNS